MTFFKTVTGVAASDFVLTTPGVIEASIIGVSGGPTVWTVMVSTSGPTPDAADHPDSLPGVSGATVRLALVGDDTINASGVPLGGAGPANGNFTSGAVVTISQEPVPALSGPALAVLALLLAAVATAVLRRRSGQPRGYGKKP